jgi:chemotaxis protein CheD
MMEYKLNIGDVITSSRKAVYTCLGLGSCIGLFIQDRMTGLSGGAHIFLPDADKESPGCTKFYSVTSAIQEIRRQLSHQGSTLEGLRAKVTGGANVLMGISSGTGARNAESVLKELARHRIYVATVDVGGNHSRTARFESDTGLLTVKIPQTNQYRIY